MDAFRGKELVTRFVAAFSEGRIDDALDMITEDYVSADAGAGLESTVGKTDFAVALRQTREAIPDLREELLDIVAEKDKVAFRIRSTGHHTGKELRGFAPTGTYLEWECFGIWTIEDGRLSGEVFLEDVPTLLACLRINAP